MSGLPVLRIHASRSGYFTRPGDIIDFETVASSIESSPLSGKQLILESCWTASTGLAGRLAARLKTWIVAPTHAPIRTFTMKDGVWGDHGEPFFCRRASAEDARWVAFDPAGEPRLKFAVARKCDDTVLAGYCESGCYLAAHYEDEPTLLPPLPGVPDLPDLD